MYASLFEFRCLKIFNFEASLRIMRGLVTFLVTASITHGMYQFNGKGQYNQINAAFGRVLVSICAPSDGITWRFTFHEQADISDIIFENSLNVRLTLAFLFLKLSHFILPKTK